MATYPIKMLKDEGNIPFVPLVGTDAIVDPQGRTLEERLSVKLGPDNLKAGSNVSITTQGYDCYINVNLPSGLTLIDNLTTTTAGQGSLDARQGSVLKGLIPAVVNNVTSTSTTSALSAYQGYLLSNKFNDYLPKSGGALTGPLSIGYTKIISHECSAGGTHIGWVKIGKLALNTSNHLGGANYLLAIERNYNSPAPETYLCAISLGWSDARITQLNAKGTQIIQKLRVAVDNTNHIAYLEMYVNPSYTTYKNGVYVSLMCLGNNDYHNNWILLNEVQTEAESALTVAGSVDLNTSNSFVGNLVGNASSATKATQDGSGNTITSTYAKLSGGNTLTGAQTVSNGVIKSVHASAEAAVYAQHGTTNVHNIYLYANSSNAGIYSSDRGAVIGYSSGWTFNGNANSATTATKATQDGNGANIASTYLKKNNIDYIYGILTSSQTISSTYVKVNYQKKTQLGSGMSLSNGVITITSADIKAIYVRAGSLNSDWNSCSKYLALGPSVDNENPLVRSYNPSVCFLSIEGIIPVTQNGTYAIWAYNSASKTHAANDPYNSIQIYAIK